MRATLNISDELVSQVQKISGEKSKTKAISIAMQEYVRQKKIKQLLALRGAVNVKDVTKELENLELKEIKHNAQRWRNR